MHVTTLVILASKTGYPYLFVHRQIYMHYILQRRSLECQYPAQQTQHLGLKEETKNKVTRQKVVHFRITRQWLPG